MEVNQTILILLTVAMTVKGQPYSYGTEFIFTFPFRNCLWCTSSLLLTTEVEDPVTVTVSVPGINYNKVINVTRHQDITINLPEEAGINEYTPLYTNKTVIARATGFVSLHGLYNQPLSADGFLVLPTNSLDNNYVLASFTLFSEFTMSALQDITTVNITDRNTNWSKEITLQRYESYQQLSQAETSTGYFITATSRVSVISGNSCGIVPTSSSPGTCDYLMEQMPPITALGRHYILAPFMGRTSGYIFRVVASQDFTIVSITNTSDSSVTTLMSGHYYEDDINDVVMITADKPVLVAQFAKTYKTDYVGDAFMVIIPSTESYSRNISFPVATLPKDLLETYLSVVISCEDVTTLSLDDNLLDNTNDMLVSPDGAFCVLRTPVSPGLHYVSHPNSETSFLVLVYGFAYAVGYGYVAGYDVQTTNEETDVITESTMNTVSAVSYGESTMNTVSAVSYGEPRTSAIPIGETMTTIVSSVSNDELTTNIVSAVSNDVAGCLPFVKPDDGTVTPDKGRYNGGDVVTIYCQQGFEVVGDGELICTSSGSWRGDIPRCEPETMNTIVSSVSNDELTTNIFSAVSNDVAGCLPFVKPDDGTVTPDKSRYNGGDVVTIYCQQGFEVVGDGELICTSSGSWRGDIPRCEPARLTLIIAASAGGLSILVFILILGVVIYCKRRKNPALPQLPVSYTTYIPPLDNSSTHPIRASGDYYDEVPLENQGYESVGDDDAVPNFQGLYAEVYT